MKAMYFCSLTCADISDNSIISGSVVSTPSVHGKHVWQQKKNVESENRKRGRKKRV